MKDWKVISRLKM